MKQRLLNILFWSVISAAFIGPGTITTAASAGAEFGYSLLWALIYITVISEFTNISLAFTNVFSIQISEGNVILT